MSQQINLFNPVFLKQKKIFSAVNMLDALALLLVGVALFYGYASIKTLNLDRQSVETARRYNQAQAQMREISTRYAPKKTDTALQAQVNTLQAQLVARKSMLDDLGVDLQQNSVSYAEYMRALARQCLEGLWLTGFRLAKGGEEMEISGRALQPELVPSYIHRLNQEAALQGRPFDSLSMTQREGELPADASGPVGAPVKYSYTEFKFGSSRAKLPAEGGAASELQAKPAPGVSLPVQTTGGGSR